MHSKYKSISKLSILLFSITLASFLGCGGGGSGDSTSEVFSANLSAGKISFEGSSDKDILYASVSGVQIGGGSIEDATGKTLASLKQNDLTQIWEAELVQDENTFTIGKYVLKYIQNSNTVELVKPNLQWTTSQIFNPAPTMIWSPSSRLLSVNFSPLSGSNVSYYLRIYTLGSILVRETDKFHGAEVSEYLSQSGSYRVMLIGEVKNGNEVIDTVRYFFSERTFNSL